MAVIKYKLVIGYLYGDLMNIYGDTGNITVLQKRAEWRGIEVVVKHIGLEGTLKSGDVDLYFFGGGQDQQQEAVALDLIKSKKGSVIKSEIEKGVPLLSICGGYQLLGEYYLPHKGERLAGIGVFPAHTKASRDRMIGNIVISTEQFGNLVGFENHSGKTFLKDENLKLGKVIKGFGNNGEDKTEGIVYKNAIGCYMHGSLLPKNPILADWLIKTALEVKYKESIKLEEINDSLEEKAHDFTVQRFT
jgi:lipid II isoglutaminyl synthase (glutamine-hydrolysing)